MSVRCRLPGVIFCGVLAALTNIRGAGADVFNMPSGDTSMQFVNVGDPGNTGDTQKMNGQNLIIGGSDDTSSGYGAVSYSYAMSTFDVTAAQYVQFLDAVATKSDPYGLYNPLMGGATSGPASSDPSDPQGTTIGWVTVSSGGKTWPVVCGITRTGTAGNYSYAVSTSAAANLGSPPIPADSGNFPVNWINFGDAVRFCNWLENGQPTGGTEGVGTTETGSYTLNGAMTIAQLFGLTHNSGAKYWIPTENEWYKAAYYKGGGLNSGYWYYPTQSNSSNQPSSTLSTTATNNANYNTSGVQSPNNWILTPVGYYAGSASHYGTFDQGGNLYNFTETAVVQSNTNPNVGEGQFVEVLRGGSFHHNIPDELASNWRYGADPAKFGHGRTFRLAMAFTTAQWSGLGSGNWSSMTNWSGDAAPYAGIALQFGALAGGTAATTNNNNDFAAGTQFSGIAFTSTAPSYNLQGSAINLAGPIQNSSSNSQIVGLNIALVAGGGTLDTGTAGLTVSGNISGAGPLTKISAGTLTLTGANTYSGGTSVNQGVLALGPGGSLPNTALTIGNNGSTSATLQVNGNYTIGTGGGAGLTLSGSAGGQGALAFSTAEASPSTLTLSGSMAVGGSSGSPALLNFNLGNGAVDTIAAGSVTVNPGGAIIGLNQLSGTSLLPGTYNLITFGSGSGLSGLTFSGGGTALSQNGETLKLLAATGAEQLAVITTPANAYWTGAQGTSSWSAMGSASNTNWGSTAGGADTYALPGATTNVFFTASAASNYTNTTLDGNFSINSLAFNSNFTGPITIAPGSFPANTLTIVGSGGINFNAGFGAVTISAPLVLGVAQTWTNNSSNLLTISGGSVGNGGNTLTLAGSGNTLISAVISGSGALIDNAAGTVGLTGASTFSGQTQAGNAALLLANSAALQNSTYIGGATNGLAFVPGIGTFTLGGLSGSSGLTLSDIGGGAVTLQVGNNGASTTYSGALSDSGSGGLTKTGSGVLTLTRANSYGGATTILAGTLQVVSGGSFGNTAISVANGATFAPMPGAGAVVAGSSGAGTAGATLNLGPGAVLDMTDGGIGTFSLNQQSGFAGTALTLGGATLKLELSSSGADSILVNMGAAAVSGTNTISIAGLGTGLTPGTYTLISAPGGLSGTLLFPNSSTSEALTVGGTPYNLTLNSSGTAETVHVSAVSAPASYQLATTVANSTIILSGSTTVTSTIQNTGSAPLDYSGLSVSLAGSGGLGSLSQSGTGLMPANSDSGACTFTGNVPGTAVLTPTVGSVTNDTTGGSASGGAPITATVTVLDHAAGSATVTSGNGFLAHAGATGISAVVTVSNAAGTRSDLQVDSAPSITSGTLSSGPAIPYFVSAGSAQTYTASFAAGNTPGVLSNTVTLASAGDNQSLPGASSPGSLSVSITGNVYSGQAEWIATSGPWGTSANWKDTVGGGPSGAPGVSGYATDTATFGAAVPGAATVTLDSAAPVLSNIVFSNSNASYFILQGSGTTALTLTGTDGSSPAAVTVLGGTHWVEAPIVLGSNLTVSSSGILTLNGGVSDGGLAKSLTLDGGGTLLLAGTDSYTGGTIVDAGTLFVVNSNAIPDSTSLTVAAGGTLIFDPGHVAVPYTVSPGAVAAVPEPGTLVLFLAGALLAAVAAWRRRRN